MNAINPLNPYLSDYITADGFLTLLFEVTTDGNWYEITCLEHPAIYTCTENKADIIPMTVEVSELVLASWYTHAILRGQLARIRTLETPPNCFRLTFDMNGTPTFYNIAENNL